LGPVDAFLAGSLAATAQTRLGGSIFWVAAALMLGAFQLRAVSATKRLTAAPNSALTGL
jgi:hypothetical protein